MTEIFCSPDICPNCQYIGEGDSICDATLNMVLDDWIPTDNFMEDCPYLKNGGGGINYERNIVPR